MTNAEIADHLNLLAKLMDIHGENAFKAKTYVQAAFQIDRYEQPLSEMSAEKIASMRGIGTSVAQKIRELVDTGQVAELTQLLDKTPEGIRQLMQIKGLGPKKLSLIWRELGIESPGELLYACQENRLIHYKGFGEKTQQNLSDAITFYLNNQGRFLYAGIAAISEEVLQRLRKAFGDESVFLSGAIERQEDIIDSIDMIVCADNDILLSWIETENDFEILESEDGWVCCRYQKIIQIDLWLCSEDELPVQRFMQSATPEFLKAFESSFPDADYYLPEPDLFASLELPVIPVCLRHDAYWIERAKKRDIPELILEQEIKGIIHAHSTWSDGEHSLREMALACRTMGFEYLVISDHSVSSFYAGGLSHERVALQQDEIARLNEELKPFKIFSSIECDILGDGSLDYPDAVLESFDLVIASVHQNLKMTQEKAMQRILPAIAHPCTRILGHPSGRLLLSRPAYPLDYPALFEACAKHGVAIEVNANPRRLDLDSAWIRDAIDSGLKLSINPDAHSIQGIRDIRYGVIAARRGGLSAAHNLSSYSLEAFEKYISKKP